MTTTEVYPNGISTSLPYDVQHDLVRSIKGFEQARITRPGYAIEYDYFDPRDLHPWLEIEVSSPACFSPARSTALPAMKRQPARDW